MTNLNILETFRTKEELINYFNEIGQSITEEEIDALKKSYEQDEKNNEQLNLQQLDNVAGGEFLLLCFNTKKCKTADERADKIFNSTYRLFTAGVIDQDKLKNISAVSLHTREIHIDGTTFYTYSDKSKDPGSFKIYCEGPDGNPMLVDRDLRNVLGRTDITDAITSFATHFVDHEQKAPEERFNFTESLSFKIPEHEVDTAGLENLKAYLTQIGFIVKARGLQAK